MFGDYGKHSVVVALDYDPQSDDDIAIWRAPQACVVTGAYMWTTNDVAGSTANYFNMALYNGGAGGTALTAMAGTIGGTAGWTGLTPKTFTVTNGTVAAGDMLVARYDETGTGTFTAAMIQIDYIVGSR